MSTGALVLVAPPTGDGSDLSPRGRDELGAADLVCCAEVVRTGRLLDRAGVTPRPLQRVGTDPAEAEAVVARVTAGERVVLVGDGAAPGAPDPGAAVVRAVLAAGLPVLSVPGPVAAVAAAVVSGLDPSRLAFDGVLPAAGPDRTARLAELGREGRTVALQEAPARLVGTLGDLVAACGPQRPVAVAWALATPHEEVWRGPVGDAVAWAEAHPAGGEVVLVVGGAVPEEAGDDDGDVRAALRAARRRGLSTSRAAAEVAAARGRPRREVYALALEDDADDGDDGDDLR